METYKLTTLLYFFEAQRKINYVGIDQIINLIENDEYVDEYKRDMLMILLHRYGLNEITYRSGEFDTSELEVSEDPVNEKINWSFLRLEIVRFHLLNGIMEQPICIN